MNVRLIISGSIVAAFSSGLIGCGGNGPADSESEPAPVVSEATPVEKKRKTRSMKLMGNALDAAEEALAKGEYVKATDALIKMQVSGNIRDQQQSWQYNRIMSSLQSELAEAAAEGDEKAVKAMQLLRRSRGVRR